MGADAANPIFLNISSYVILIILIFSNAIKHAKPVSDDHISWLSLNIIIIHTYSTTYYFIYVLLLEKKIKGWNIIYIYITQRSSSSSYLWNIDTLGISPASSFRANRPRILGRLSASVFRHAYCYVIIITTTFSWIYIYIYI